MDIFYLVPFVTNKLIIVIIIIIKDNVYNVKLDINYKIILVFHK